MYAKVVLDIPDLKHQGFDYRIPSSLIDTLKIGCRVIVPLGNRATQGYVIEIKDDTDFKNIKEIKENLDIIPLFSLELIELAKWMSEYYSTHLYRCLQTLIPPALKSKFEEYLLINETADDIQLLTDKETVIYNWIKNHQPIQKMLVFKQFPNSRKIINNMILAKVVCVNREYKDEAKRKIIKTVKLNITLDQLSQELSILPNNAKKQKEVLEYFVSNKLTELDLTSLVDKFNINITTLQPLIKKDILYIIKREIDRNPYKNKAFKDKKVVLTEEQKNVLNKILISLDKKIFRPILINGVTGSGKTEIYLNLITHMLMCGKDSIILVPEISLTSQMVERFKGRFGDKVAVLHSRLSRGEKLDEWLRIQRGAAKIVIGARSAVFAPFKEIGLIILDEEHEASYKQEEHPKYHTREIAKWRAKHNNSLVLFGSATPSIESYYSAINNDYLLIELPNRIEGRTLPKINLIDMREELKNGNRTMFSRVLDEQIVKCLEKKEQIILFLNRRGYSTFVMCRSCGYVIKCPNCEITLTYHHSNRVLRCHYCGYSVNEPRTCPECNSKYIRYFGTGTQKVEEELALRYPGVRVIRMDVDSTNTKGSHDRLLTSFKNQEADILLGTQMIAKGLDFERVTLVGVIAADTTLRLPDFRAAERTFQLLTQVSGRAGRHDLAGNVIIQTYTPEHYSIQYASNNNYTGFFKHELEQRRIMGYPPYQELVLVLFSHELLSQVMKASQLFVKELRELKLKNIEISEPVASPISRINNKYRFQCIIKISNESNVVSNINQTITYIIDEFKDRRLQISIDRDPYMLM